MEPIRVLVVDDHVFVRRGIQMFLKTEPSIEVIGEAENGRQAIAKAHQFRPDVILMDLSMTQMGGIEAIAIIKSELPGTKIIVLTMHQQEDMVRAAIETGADGYLLKDSSEDTLLKAIYAVQQGGLTVHPAVARYLLKGASHPEPELNTPPAISLTEREEQVLQLLVTGISNKSIAKELSLGSGTVKIYVSNILSKLNASSRTEAVVKALELGLIKSAQQDN